MERTYFMETERLGFSRWTRDDLDLARLLWGDPAVTRFICAAGVFSEEDILRCLDTEVANGARFHVQYWPVFLLDSRAFIGCCGLRPHGERGYEIGFHLRPAFWGRGYASEAAAAVIRYAFSLLCAEELFAGHNPRNAASRKTLTRLGFHCTGDEFYEPTGLYHPSYALRPEDVPAVLSPPRFVLR